MINDIIEYFFEEYQHLDLIKIFNEKLQKMLIQHSSIKGKL